VLAGLYEAHGLYEEALAQIERVAEMDPTSPFAQARMQSMHHQLGKE
jgi:hypothetical protein